MVLEAGQGWPLGCPGGCSGGPGVDFGLPMPSPAMSPWLTRFTRGWCQGFSLQGVSCLPAGLSCRSR